jgi:hypothetical protein
LVDADRLKALREVFAALAKELELEAAHHREYVPDGVAASAAVRRALSAAVADGYAAALRHVLEVLE